jgi:UDP:flavonoid glycosyltransferase YjiC (YdhE family)
MRVLFTSSAGAGHLLPMLPLARAVRQAGHEVSIATGSSLARFVAGAGFRHFEVQPESIETVRAAFPEIEPLSGVARNKAMWRLVFGGRIAEGMAAGVLELARDWPPDLIVHEDLDFGAWIAAERLRVPQATVQATAWRPALRAAIAEPMAALRSRHGLPPEPDVTGLYGLIYFTTRPPSLRDPGAPLPAGFGELRPVPDDDPGGGEIPDWLATTPGRKRVAVTLGTVNTHRTDILRPIVDGLGRSETEVVVALGVDPATLGDVAPNVRVERYVPLSLLLPRSDAIVCHGGSGTVLAAAAAGVPLVIVPLAADQPANAAACVAAGVGRVLGPADITAELVLDAVGDVLGDPRYRQRAGAVAAEVAAMPGPADAVRKLEGLV